MNRQTVIAVLLWPQRNSTVHTLSLTPNCSSTSYKIAGVCVWECHKFVSGSLRELNINIRPNNNNGTFSAALSDVLIISSWKRTCYVDGQCYHVRSKAVGAGFVEKLWWFFFSCYPCSLGFPLFNVTKITSLCPKLNIPTQWLAACEVSDPDMPTTDHSVW